MTTKEKKSLLEQAKNDFGMKAMFYLALTVAVAAVGSGWVGQLGVEPANELRAHLGRYAMPLIVAAASN